MFLAIAMRPEVEKSVELQHGRSNDVPARGVHAGCLEHADPHRIVAALGVALAMAESARDRVLPNTGPTIHPLRGLNADRTSG